VAHQGRPGSVGVGTGGKVGSGGVLVGGGLIGGAVGGTAVAGGAVGGGAVGGAGGGAVGGADGRVTGVGVAVAPWPGGGTGCAEGVVGLALGDAVGTAVGSLGVCLAPALFVMLKPASAMPTASDGPRSTYSVNEARPPRPGALPPGFPSRPPIAW
jgi:hypothetical protein